MKIARLYVCSNVRGGAVRVKESWLVLMILPSIEHPASEHAPKTSRAAMFFRVHVPCCRIAARHAVSCAARHGTSSHSSGEEADAS